MTARWPALMRKRTAAEYCDMSEAAFLREIVAGRFPAGVMIGGQERWRMDALDAVNALLEAGVTVAEVSAITGQSFRIVEQYGKRMNRGVMSYSGVTKLDDRRKKLPKQA